jgi:glycosyltransferase involved in cell wall biosynthesis
MCERERCVLALIGNGDQRSALEAEAQRLGIAPRVRFVGHSDRVHEFLAASDVFVLPSTYEPFGNALIEAMAAGLPCVALRPDGPTIRLATAEIMRDGATGFLVASGDPADMAARLDGLVRDGALRERFGAAGQARCRERYNWERCARGYLALAGAPDLEGSPTVPGAR